MKELKVFKFILKPESYFSEKLSSFTIFGALCWAVRFLYGEKELSRLIESVKKGEFLLSSAMPRIDGKDYVFKPILKPLSSSKCFPLSEIVGSTKSVKIFDSFSAISVVISEYFFIFELCKAFCLKLL